MTNYKQCAKTNASGNSSVALTFVVLLLFNSFAGVASGQVVSIEATRAATTTNTTHATIITPRSKLCRVAQIREELLRPDSQVVLVVAHRGDWRNAPENSLQAIRFSIAMGVDIVEIDVQKTKDGQLVLVHDKTLDRTTTGSGKVSDHTLAELSKLHLRNGQGRATLHKIPTLEEAMIVAKGNIMVNLDKCYDMFGEAYQVLKKTGTTDHAIIKGNVSLGKARNDFGQFMDEVLFMPVVDLEGENARKIVNSYVNDMKPVAFEFVFEHELPAIDSTFRELRRKGSRIWVNTLWPELCGGHDDDLAVFDIERSYGWIVDSGVNIIQTDRPALLLDYLESRGLRYYNSQSSATLAPSR